MPERSANRHHFFFWFSCTLLLLVIVAFAPGLLSRSPAEVKAMPIHLHVHGTVLTSWFVWFVVQTNAVRRGSLATHRKLGAIGVAIGVACVFAGPAATLGGVSTLRSYGLDWDTDMSAYPLLGIEGIAMETYAKQLVFGNFASIAAFAALLTAAVLFRHKAATHKRLMTLASISIVTPALARISRWPGLGGEDAAFIPIAFLTLLMALVLYDVQSEKRIHRATVGGILIIVSLTLGAALLAITPFATAVVRAMA